MSMTVTSKMATWDLMLLLTGVMALTDGALRYTGTPTFQMDVAVVILTGLASLSICYAMFKHAAARGWTTGFVLVAMVLILALVLCQLNGVNDLVLQIVVMVSGSILSLMALSELLWTELPMAAVMEVNKEKKHMKY